MTHSARETERPTQHDADGAGRVARLAGLGVAVAGGVVALALLGVSSRRRLGAAVRRRMLLRMERLMAGLPENSPPRLVMSVLPRLREQNDQIIAMLREQNELLRASRQKAR